MAPTRTDGGLYYPRNDTIYDADGHLREVEPMTGNVLLGYARLNVPDGLWTLYNRPLDRSHFEAPTLTSVARDVDVRRAEVVDGALTVTLHRRTDLRAAETGADPDSGAGTVTVGRVLGRGRWRLTELGGTELATVDGGTVIPSPASPNPPARATADGLLLNATPVERTLVLHPAR
jgi:hypothetical protein